MVKKELISKENINITVVLNPNSNLSFFQSIFEYVSIYLKIDVEYVSIAQFNEKNTNEISVRKEKVVDFIFVDFIKEYEYIFAWNFYSKMHNINRNFKLVLFRDKIDENDIKYFKNGADDIIYTNEQYYEDKEKYLKWKIFSLLRRKWDYSHQETILNRNGVIIDLVKRKVIKNNKEIKISTKEFDILTLLVEEFNTKEQKFISKNKIFKSIYGINNKDNSRVVDVTLFRLKQKFPDGFFVWDKRKGIKIS